MSHPPAIKSRQIQALESRQAFIRAATSLFNERGYLKSSVQDICSAAGLSVGLFYNHFPTKRDVLKAVLNQKTHELMEMIDTESSANTHVEAILEVFSFVCRQQVADSFPMICSTFLSSLGGTRGMDERLYKFICRIIQSGQDNGELTTECLSSVIAEDLFAAGRGYMLLWCEKGCEGDVQQGQQAYLRRILRGYLGPNGRLPE